MEDRQLRIRLLGELQVTHDRRRLTLPASKKTRALLGYLVASPGPHRRERLCDLLWEGPDDPRAELRWSLHKLRPLVDTELVRLNADRDRIAFEPRGAEIDLVIVQQLVGSEIAAATLDNLKAASALLQGEFLDGLDLPACYRFQEWCLAERERVSALRVAILNALIERLEENPAEALVHARALVAADPLSEVAHAAVVRLLGRTGRRREALAHVEHARRILESELGGPLSGALDQARRAIGPVRGRSIPLEAAPEKRDLAPRGQWTETPVPFIGRRAERERLDDLLSATANGGAHPVVLVTGEPGIGKSRLLQYLHERMVMIGGHSLRGRGFEAEATRPYGAWIDALRGIPADRIPHDPDRALALLRPDLGVPAPEQADRAQLFDRVVELLKHLSDRSPLLLVLDDLQWLDEASSSLFHYVARVSQTPSRLLIACAARPGELEDNPPASRAIRSLAREDRLVELALAPLSEAETAELVRIVDPNRDPKEVFAKSEGNPLFALEVTRAHRQGDGEPSTTLNAVIAGQFSRLQERTRDLMVWAAALGRSFSPILLGRISGFETRDLLRGLDELERRGIVQATSANDYDFVHDLVREVAYRTLTQPRRKLVHRHIAHHLAPAAAIDNALASDLARHAALCGEDELAARACLAAGERCLRLFANAEGNSFADRGLRHLERLADGRRRLKLLIGLLKVKILASSGPAMRPLPPIAETLARAVAEAEAEGLSDAAATGHFLLSVLHQEAGDTARAQESTVRAAEAGRAADQATRAHQLANTARCLLELETEIPRARALIEEAEAIFGPDGDQVCELCWGRGLLRRWDGNTVSAAALIERALTLARNAEDRWREYKCLTWLALVEFELERYEAARDRCGELLVVAQKLGESDSPFAQAIDALAGLAAGIPDALAALDQACASLRKADDKTYLAYTLNAAASLCLKAGRTDIARMYASEAQGAARAMHRFGDMALAQATLARMGEDEDTSARDIGRLLEEISEGDRANARTRSALLAVANAIGVVVPTMVSTQPRQNGP